MIRFAQKNQKQEIINIWQISFPKDSPEFVEMYFTKKYKEENTLVYMIDDKVVSCLQMLPYEVTFHNHVCQMSYISGAATLPDYQNKGIMGKLLTQSFIEMKNRGDLFTALIPQEPWLIEYYQKYGFTLCPEYSLMPIMLDVNSCVDSFSAADLDKTEIEAAGNGMVRMLDVEKVLQ